MKIGKIEIEKKLGQVRGRKLEKLKKKLGQVIGPKMEKLKKKLGSMPKSVKLKNKSQVRLEAENWKN